MYSTFVGMSDIGHQFILKVNIKFCFISRSAVAFYALALSYLVQSFFVVDKKIYGPFPKNRTPRNWLKRPD